MTGVARVPRLREDLQDIATELYSGRSIEREFGGELYKDKVYVIIQIIGERSSSWSSSASSSAFDKSNPLSDRADIREALREHGFGDDIFQDLDVRYEFDVVGIRMTLNCYREIMWAMFLERMASASS